MEFKIFEEDTRYELEEKLNEFAKNNEIQHISLTASKSGCTTYYAAVVSYVSQICRQRTLKHVRNQKSKSVTWFAVKQKSSSIHFVDM